MSHLDIEKDMALNYYRPATALEALAFGAQYPEMQKRLAIHGFHLIDTDHCLFIPDETFNPNILLKYEKRGLIECKPGAISIIKPGANCSTHEKFINKLHKKKIQTANSNILDY